MPSKPARKPRNTSTAIAPSKPQQNATRNAKGQWLRGSNGYSGLSAQSTLDLARARKALNLVTVQAMHEAFQRGGRQAIDKVMRNAPAQFLKMLVLLVPRELEVTTSTGVKGMSDEQLARSIEALEAMIARRSGDAAKVIEADPMPAPMPSTDQPDQEPNQDGA